MTKTEEETMTNAPDNPKAAYELLLEKERELEEAYQTLMDVEQTHILSREMVVALETLNVAFHRAEDKIAEFADESYEG